MKLKPLWNQILVEPEPQEQKSAGGIIIPGTVNEKPQRGVVISCGEGKPLENGTVRPMRVKEGDSILFGRYSGSEVTLDNKEYLLMQEEDVFGLCED